jgi:hypothetical protein
MKKTHLILAASAVAVVYALSVSAAEKSPPETAKSEEVKTVAWYVANIKEARAKNKECYSNPGAVELQATPNCINSLQALKMSFALAN